MNKEELTELKKENSKPQKNEVSTGYNKVKGEVPPADLSQVGSERKLSKVALITLQNTYGKIGQIEIYPKNFKPEIEKRTIISLRQISMEMKRLEENGENGENQKMIRLLKITKDEITKSKILEVVTSDDETIELKEHGLIMELEGIKKWL